MKTLQTLKWIVALLLFTPMNLIAQEGKVKIYEKMKDSDVAQKSDGNYIVVFPNDSKPLMVMMNNEKAWTIDTMPPGWSPVADNTQIYILRESPTRPSSGTAAGKGTGVVSPRDAASGLPTGKRQHKPYLLSSFSMDQLEQDSGNGIEIYSFSWGMSNSGSMSTGSASTGKRAAATPTRNGCTNGMCSVTVSVDKKHTKSGHVTLMK